MSAVTEGRSDRPSDIAVVSCIERIIVSGGINKKNVGVRSKAES